MCREGKAVFRRFSQLLDGTNRLVLFPDEDGKVNYYGLLYLDEHLVRNLKKEAVIVTSCPGVMRVASLFTPKIKDIVMVTEREMDCLIAYLKLSEGAIDFTIVSLTKPAGRRGEYLVGAKGLTVEQMVAIGIYFIIPYRQIIRSFDFSSSDPASMEIMKEAS